MEEKEMNGKDELFSKAVKAGKRTYFFDVKTTKGDEQYITITESKRRFDTDQNRFFYEKHKIFLYKEDFEKVAKGLNDAINFVQTGEYPEDYYEVNENNYNEGVEDKEQIDSAIDKWFDELGKDNA
ncbi:MAG: DUF3276 family protein [Bacteroidales bacterium]|nr:DUF3276 family protein [Bacteroidales bacterium]